MRRLIVPVTCLIFMSLISCEQYIIDLPDVPTDVSYSADVQPIFDANCTACHNGGTDPNLSSGNSYDALIDDGFVDTGDPEASLIYVVLTEGAHASRATDLEKLTILGWIMEGAEDN
ncbi:MAG: hypothetical protein R2751_01945 [Bacteroidales bacterium]